MHSSSSASDAPDSAQFVSPLWVHEYPSAIWHAAPEEPGAVEDKEEDAHDNEDGDDNNDDNDNEEEQESM